MDMFEGNGDRRKRSSLVFGVAVLALMAVLVAFPAGAAFAASGKVTSAGDQYKAVIVVKSAVAKQTKPASGVKTVAAVKTSSNGLPFTGISLAATAVLGVGLVGLGVMLRRRGRHEGS